MLNQTDRSNEWGDRSGSNRRPPGSQPGALTDCATATLELDSTPGFEPGTACANGFAIRRLEPLGYVEMNVLEILSRLCPHASPAACTVRLAAWRRGRVGTHARRAGPPLVHGHTREKKNEKENKKRKTGRPGSLRSPGLFRVLRIAARLSAKPCALSDPPRHPHQPSSEDGFRLHGNDRGSDARSPGTQPHRRQAVRWSGGRWRGS